MIVSALSDHDDDDLPGYGFRLINLYFVGFSVVPEHFDY